MEVWIDLSRRSEKRGLGGWLGRLFRPFQGSEEVRSGERDWRSLIGELDRECDDLRRRMGLPAFGVSEKE